MRPWNLANPSWSLMHPWEKALVKRILVSLYLSLSIYLFDYLPKYLSVHMHNRNPYSISMSMSISIPVFVSAYSFYTYLDLYTHLSISRSISLSISRPLPIPITIFIFIFSIYHSSGESFATNSSPPWPGKAPILEIPWVEVSPRQPQRSLF